MIVGITGPMGIGKTYYANKLVKKLNEMGIKSHKDSFARQVKKFAKDIFFVTKEGHYLNTLFPYPNYREELSSYLLQEKPYVINNIVKQYPLLKNQEYFSFLEGVVEEVSIDEVMTLIKLWQTYYETYFDINYRQIIARKMLQLIGRFGRTINPEYWINFVKQTAKDVDIVVVDDLRFLNESDKVDYIIVLVPSSIGTYFELLEQRHITVSIEALKDVSEKEWGLIAELVLSEHKDGMWIWIEHHDSLNDNLLNLITGSVILKYDELKENSDGIIIEKHE